jgi:hypothetical protein
VVADDTDDPYGNAPVTTGLFRKPEHLATRPLAVQQAGTLFGLLEITPNLTSTSLATNVIFPLLAESVFVDNTAVPAAMQTLAASTTSVLGVRDSGGCVAARILMADPYGGAAPAPVQVVVDGMGLGLNVGRLVVYHAAAQADAVLCSTSWTTGKPPLACKPRAAIVLASAACSTDSDLFQLMATVRSATFGTSDASTPTWTASLNIGGSTFVGARDRTNGKVTTQSVDGTQMKFSALCVNGTDPSGSPCD